MNEPSVALDLDEARLPLKIINLAWPVMAQETFAILVGLVGTVIVGRLGAEALAAIGLAFQVIWFPEVILIGVGVGATAIIARRVGEGRPQEASDALGQSILMGAIIGLLFAPLMWLLAEPLMVFLQAKGSVVELGVLYIRASAPGLVPALAGFAANSAMQGAGHTRTAMYTMIVANLANIVFGYALVYGFLGIPALGVMGAGIASSIAWACGFVFAMYLLIRGVGPLRYGLRKALRFDPDVAGQIIKVGAPAGAEQLQFQVAFIFFSIVVSALGTTVYAAHTVALRVEGLAFMPGFGLGVAATTLVGQALGAGRPDLAQRTASLAQWYAIAIMTFAGLFMGIFRNGLMGIFVTDQAVIEIGSAAILIYAFSMPFMGTMNCLAGGLRGAGDTRAVMIIMTAGAWLIRIPLSYILAYWVGLGAVGAWSAAVLDINARSLLIWRRFAGGRWKTIKV